MKLNLLNILSLIVVIFLMASCNKPYENIEFLVANPSTFERNDVLSIKKKHLELLLADKPEEGILIREKGTDSYLVTQWLDADQDGMAEELLFQATIDANQSKSYEIMWAEEAIDLVPKSYLKTFSRFVPERTDDYAWENDKVAFRTYGPEAERLTFEGEEGGTLSSGIDLWLKKVDYSIIDKWYQGHIDDPGYYHIDHGEGYDPYHVGSSRGTGGIGVWELDMLITSRNFTTYNTITTGPLRTVFELSYEPWSTYKIQEAKRITLDLGSNFSKFEVSLNSDQAPNYTLGITTHDLNGQESMNFDQGWFSYWEQINDAYLGSGIVVEPKMIEKAFVHESDTKDQSQLMIVCRSNINVLTYYAGFAWTKSGQVSSQSDWEILLERQSEIINNPLKVEFGGK